jgi:hypothetical protein
MLGEDDRLKRKPVATKPFDRQGAAVYGLIWRDNRV